MHTVTPDTRHAAASAVVIDTARNTVLLVDHRASGCWVFPGGHVDPGESPAEAALREVWEETGVRARLVDQPGVTLPGMTAAGTPWLVMEIPAPAKPDRGPGKPAEPAHWHIDHLFICEADSSLPLLDGDEGVAAARWVPIDHVRDLPVRADIPEVVRLARRRLNRRLVIRDGATYLAR